MFRGSGRRESEGVARWGPDAARQDLAPVAVAVSDHLTLPPYQTITLAAFTVGTVQKVLMHPASRGK